MQGHSCLPYDVKLALILTLPQYVSVWHEPLQPMETFSA